MFTRYQNATVEKPQFAYPIKFFQMTSMHYRILIFKSDSHIPIFTTSRHSFQVQLLPACSAFFEPPLIQSVGVPPTSSPGNRKLPGDSSKEKTELMCVLHIHQLHKIPKTHYNAKFFKVICYQRRGTALGTKATGVFVEAYAASLTEKTNSLNPLMISIPESSTFG